MAKYGKQNESCIANLRMRIARWRRARYARCPLPQSLWNESTTLARRIGVYQAAIALGVSYDSLRKRVDQRATENRGPTVDGFVELSGAQLLGIPATSGTEVELVNTDGSRLIIRLGNGNTLDVPGLLESIRRFRS